MLHVDAVDVGGDVEQPLAGAEQGAQPGQQDLTESDILPGTLGCSEDTGQLLLGPALVFLFDANLLQGLQGPCRVADFIVLVDIGYPAIESTRGERHDFVAQRPQGGDDRTGKHQGIHDESQGAEQHGGHPHQFDPAVAIERFRGGTANMTGNVQHHLVQRLAELALEGIHGRLVVGNGQCLGALSGFGQLDHPATEGDTGAMAGFHLAQRLAVFRHQFPQAGNPREEAGIVRGEILFECGAARRIALRNNRQHGQARTQVGGAEVRRRHRAGQMLFLEDATVLDNPVHLDDGRNPYDQQCAKPDQREEQHALKYRQVEKGSSDAIEQSGGRRLHVSTFCHAVGGRLAPGSQIVTVVPAPTLLARLNSPPCNSTISLTMLIPSPVPRILPDVSAR